MKVFSRNAWHLWKLFFLIVVVGAGSAFARTLMVPESFGQLGPYRAAALDEIASRPVVFQADKVCLECHTDVEEERAESPHKAVRCWHCHGIGREHVAAARKAEESGDDWSAEAEEWDGNFYTSQDLFITDNRASCLACHLEVVGMPEDFLGINVEEHLEEMEAEEPDSLGVCFECHGGHDPAP